MITVVARAQDQESRNDMPLSPQQSEIDFEAVDGALARLEALDPGQGRLVELRFFGGLSIKETAEVPGPLGRGEGGVREGHAST